MFIVETSRGTRAGLPDAQWFGGKFSSTLAQARVDLAEVFADKLYAEDRGEEYEHEWHALAERAKDADVGEALSFDEFAARIVEETN